VSIVAGPLLLGSLKALYGGVICFGSILAASIDVGSVVAGSVDSCSIVAEYIVVESTVA